MDATGEGSRCAFGRPPSQESASRVSARMTGEVAEAELAQEMQTVSGRPGLLEKQRGDLVGGQRPVLHQKPGQPQVPGCEAVRERQQARGRRWATRGGCPGRRWDGRWCGRWAEH